MSAPRIADRDSRDEVKQSSRDGVFVFVSILLATSGKISLPGLSPPGILRSAMWKLSAPVLGAESLLTEVVGSFGEVTEVEWPEDAVAELDVNGIRCGESTGDAFGGSDEAAAEEHTIVIGSVVSFLLLLYLFIYLAGRMT